MRTAATPLIDIVNASVYRGSSLVFDKLNLRVEQGEHLAILGPNGSGKSTLLKLLHRELYAVVSDNSWVRVLGRDRWNVWELRARIGTVSDELQMRYSKTESGLRVVLSGFLSSIGMHGNLARRIDADHRKAASAIMEKLAISHLAEKPLAEMSTGEQRRCLLARALVHDPDTLIFDEPTAGLDMAAGFDFLGRIRDLASAGKSILLVTHHLNDIPPEIDRVVLLRQGRIVADGPKRSVLTAANLQTVYGVALRISEIDGYFVATPAKPPMLLTVDSA